MSLIQVQDDIFRRVLDFLGLRGVVPHGYESTVLPVLHVGNMGQRTIVKRATPFVPSGNAIFTVPAGETWRVLAISGNSAQTGGTVAHRFGMQWNEQTTGETFLLPIYSQIDTRPESLTVTATLNASINWCTWIRQEFLVPAGWQLREILYAGDGSVTMQTCFIQFQRLGERLVDLE